MRKRDDLGTLPVDRNVPIPRPRGMDPRIPWDRMRVGDSVYLAGCTYAYAKRQIGFRKMEAPDEEYTARLVDDGQGCRVWRTG